MENNHALFTISAHRPENLFTRKLPLEPITVDQFLFNSKKHREHKIVLVVCQICDDLSRDIIGKVLIPCIPCSLIRFALSNWINPNRKHDVMRLNLIGAMCFFVFFRKQN